MDNRVRKTKMDPQQRREIERAVESLGDVVVLGLNQLPYTQSFEEDEYGGETRRQKLKEYRGDLNRSRFGTGGAIYDGNEMDASEIDDDIRRGPINVEQLNIPTSTSNVSRPRTLAAGYYLYVGERAKAYADQRGTLTVMFRDGTFYNYYNVPPGVWQEFKSSISKGPMVNRRNKNQGADGILLSYPHGPADVSQVPEELQKYVYRAARSAQLSYQKTSQRRRIKVGETYRVTGTDTFRRRSKRGETYGYVPTSAQRTIKSRAKGKGTNPASSRGRNPYQK